MHAVLLSSLIMSTMDQAGSLEHVMSRVRSRNDAIFLLDGGTGEELFTKIPDDRKLWAATAVVHPKYHTALKDVHRSFLKAGAQAITTVYGICPGVGFSDEEIQLHCATASRLAREVVDEEKSVPTAFVFGSIGPLVESYRADLILEHNRGVSVYRTSANALAPNVDAFLAETLSCVEEAFQVIEAVCQIQKPLLISFTVDKFGNLRSGEEVVSSIRHVLEKCKHHSVNFLSVLFNCSEPESITKSLEAIRGNKALSAELQSEGILLGAYANRLAPVDPNWTMAASATPQPQRMDLDPTEYFEDFVAKWLKMDVKIVGGCCGISPEHIAFLRDHLQSQ